MSDPNPQAHPSPRRCQSARVFLLLFVVLAYAIGIRLATIDAPFHRTNEGLSSFYGILARNYFRHDWRETLGVPVQSIGVHADVKPTYYDHHPPLVPMMIAAVYGIADDPHQPTFIPAEWQTRLPTALFTLGCIVVIFMLVQSRAGPRAAFLAAGIFAAMPITIVFGGAADVINSQLVFFILLTVAAYLRFHDRANAKNLLLLSAAFAGAGWTDWPAYFIVPVLLVHFLLTRPAKFWPWIFAFCALASFIFAIAYVQIVLVNHDWLWIIDLVKRRSVESSGDRSGGFTWVQWLRDGLWRHNMILHTLPVVALAVAYIALALFRQSPSPGNPGEGRGEGSSSSTRLSPTDRTLTLTLSRDTGRGNNVATLLRILLAWAAIHILIGRQGVFQHPWWWWPLTPGLAIAAGMMLDWICRGVDRLSARPWPGCVVAAVMLIAFATWTTPQSLRALDRDPHPIPAAVVGEAIRQAVPPNTSVLLADSDIDSPALWYYSDRPIVLNIWTAAAVRTAVEHPEKATLVWSSAERWPFPPAAYLYPKKYAADSGSTVIDQLRQDHPVTETPDLWIVDLRQN